jgi:hypothetical protein
MANGSVRRSPKKGYLKIKTGCLIFLTFLTFLVFFLCFPLAVGLILSKISTHIAQRRSARRTQMVPLKPVRRELWNGVCFERFGDLAAIPLRFCGYPAAMWRQFERTL